MRLMPRTAGAAWAAAMAGATCLGVSLAVHADGLPSANTSPARAPLSRNVDPHAQEGLGRLAKPPSLPPLAHGDVPSDSIDRLREKLAERLGSRGLTETASGHVLRVVARPGADSPSPPPSKRRAARAPAGAASAAVPRWSYQGTAGPHEWGQLHPEFAACLNGKRQSPIDIRDEIAVQMDPVQFDYKPSAFRVVDNGHTVQVNVERGNAIEVMGRRYELEQFHFHRPSEERVNSRQFDMSAHLVHRDLQGRMAIVAVLLERGGAHPAVQMVWNNLPLEKGEELAARAPIDMNLLLPGERGYYTYMGSLTHPPCTEGVLWMVMKTPVAVSPEQIGIFSRLYPMNARPTQAASGRLIKGSD